ncbi:MAG TPA: bifunctional isocitrate dehydrogenase kinase/phosphatase [Thermoanaerobaculia bacterium]|jgi:isocitrate dehydrogenase kinase/phosphatase|nr:bifunctional isocitrate dehydrogenase kinase/phosphatase [Thermoanaerobaculia bacterium]
MTRRDPASPAERGADTIHWAFDEHQHRLRAITHRVKERFERCDWIGTRLDTVERLALYPRSIRRTYATLEDYLGARISDRELWAEMKEAYTRATIGRDDFELAETYFNSLTRRVFPHVGVDPAIDYGEGDFPLPYKGWEMADARMYTVRRIDAPLVRKVLEDAGFRTPFRDLEKDARLAAAHIERGLREGLATTSGTADIEAFDVLRPIFFRNKGAYVIGRARRGEAVLPIVLALLNDEAGLWVDAVLASENEVSILFSFARWYFHIDVASPRGVIGFLTSILPRKRISELYLSLGFEKHGKTELYRDLMHHIARSEERFEVAPGQRGLVMEVFTLPSYEFVFKVIKDSFPPSKATTREQVMERYRSVLLHDRVGRLIGFQEFEHLTFPRARFSDDLLQRLLAVAGRTVLLEGDRVVIRHLYVERRVVPLDLYIREASAEDARAAVVNWGTALKDLAAANIFPGDILLKNFGVTRHGRVVSYDYDELRLLTDCRFLRLPQPHTEEEEMASEPWFSVGEDDIFPAELRTFLGLDGELREAFLREHSDLFEVELWHRLQERIRRGEVIDFFPYGKGRRLRPGWRRQE